MRRQFAAALCSAALGVAAASSLAIAQPGQVHASIKDVMDSIIDPSADVLWGAVGTIVDKNEGTIERLPKTQQDWMDIRRAAVRIIEGANLLMIPGRATAPPCGHPPRA